MARQKAVNPRKTILKSGKVSWEARYKDPTGRDRSKSFPYEKDAKAFLDAQRTKIRTGEWISPEDMKTTMLDVAKEWHAEAVKDNTVANRKALVDNLGDLGSMRLVDIKPSSIVAWNQVLLAGRPWKNGKPLAASSVAVMTGQLSGLLKRAQQDGLLVRVPRISVKTAPPKRAISRQDLLTPDEIGQMLHVAINGMPATLGPGTPKRPWLADMIWVALGTGARISEICGLHPEDLDVLRKELTLTRQAKPGGRETAVLKTEKPRTLPISKGTVDLLERRIKDLGVGNGSPIFPHPQQSRIYHDRNSAGRTLSTIPIRLGWVKTPGFHDLRHYYASSLIAQGASVVEVQQALGHSQPSITMDVYTHLWEGHESRTRAASEISIALVRDSGGILGAGLPTDDLAVKRRARSGA